MSFAEQNGEKPLFASAEAGLGAIVSDRSEIHFQLRLARFRQAASGNAYVTPGCNDTK